MHLDAVVMPALPATAAAIDAPTITTNGRQEPIEAAHARFASIASVTGAPAVTLPCGRGRDGLPIGIELVARPGREQALRAAALRFAALVERGGPVRAVASSLGT